jgi:predicted nucleic acid-binding protein
MMILLDANVLSDVMQHRPEPAVMTWIDSQEPDVLWTCSLVVAEVLSGLDLMSADKRQEQLREKAEFMFSTLFPGHIFPLDEAVARVYAAVLKARRSLAALLTKWTR